MDVRGEFLAELEEQVGIHDLQARRIRQVPRLLYNYFRKCKPDVTLVHMWPLTTATVIAWRLAGSPGKLFLCEHVGLTEHIQRDLSIPLIVAKMILHWSHPRASGLIAVSQGAASDLANLIRLPSNTVQVIYNPVVYAEPFLRSRSSESEPHQRQLLWQGQFSKTLINIGTLKRQKNHLLLLEAFSHVAEELDAGLVILGEGMERQSLEKRVKELGLQRRVRLPGFDSNPMRWLYAADLFVLSSDFEGLPTVLIEALACGTPVVSTACPHGPDEILDHGRYGVLVPVNDSMLLAHGIRAALNRVWNPTVLRARALEFSIPKQSTAYLNLFGLNF
jgi:glycosyltransferase involved in cell wall biosynthesis